LKILVFTVPSWNSKVGANSWATLLSQYDSNDIANIYIRDEIPDSDICSRYFNISENKVIKSILKRNFPTGKEVCAQKCEEQNDADLQAHNARYQKMKQKRRYSMLLARELVWKLGKWKTKELDAFLDDFNPDIILHSMDGYIHLNRIIEYAIKRTGARAVGYIWDDNFTYKQHSDFGYKFYRYFQRRSLVRLAKKTDEFFAISDFTKEEADRFFNVNCHILTKPLNSEPKVEYGEIQKPIKMLYTGNLFIGRDQSLLKLVKIMERLPENSVFLDVYTQTPLNEAQMAQIDPKVCCIHEPIAQAEVLKKQKEADMLLFLEAIDGPDAKVARLSFSTKITDYLSSGRCIFAIGNSDTAPMQYFIRNHAAIVCKSDDDILTELKRICTQPDIINEYAEKAMISAKKNHAPEHIQKVFDTVILSAVKNKKEI